jgi:hypothetical protein
MLEEPAQTGHFDQFLNMNSLSLVFRRNLSYYLFSRLTTHGENIFSHNPLAYLPVWACIYCLADIKRKKQRSFYEKPI